MGQKTSNNIRNHKIRKYVTKSLTLHVRMLFLYLKKISFNTTELSLLFTNESSFPYDWPNAVFDLATTYGRTVY